MAEWQSPETAPTDERILVYGLADPPQFKGQQITGISVFSSREGKFLGLWAGKVKGWQPLPAPGE